MAPLSPDAAINRLAPMLHVADVQESVRFYEQLGFTPFNILRHPDGRAFWAKMTAGEATIMFAAASGPVPAEDQAIIVYLYSNDVAALRGHLLVSGVNDGSTFQGHSVPHNGRNIAFVITHPFYMPRGELRVADPDGYCLLIGQLG